MADPFLVVGAMKSGTTSVHELLTRHPGVDVVVDKEQNALADPSGAPRFIDAVRASAHTVAGEVSAGYMQAPLMPQPLETAALLGSTLRVVAILRDPVDRAVSHWEHWTQIGRETRTVEAALLDPAGPYVAFSRYYDQLSPWRNLVGEDRCLVLRMEDLAAEPLDTAARLFTFLGVSGLPADQSHVHANAGHRRRVATGWRAVVRSSPAYRRLIRPALPAAARQRLATASPRSTVRGLIDPASREAFAALIADDQASSIDAWPGMRW